MYFILGGKITNMRECIMFVNNLKHVIEVRSSCGQIGIDCMGNILSLTEYPEAIIEGADSNFKYLREITKFDMEEFYTYYGMDDLPSTIDILDLGYWVRDGRYEPPEKDWREMIMA